MLDMKKVGVKISSLRKSIGCSQEKLADLLSVTPQAISKWENGHSLPETSSLPILAQVFGCGIDDIIIPAYTIDERVEQDKPNTLELQAEHIANVVFSKMEDKQKSNEHLGFTDEEITESVCAKHPDIGRVVINRGKTSRTTGDICTPILVSSATPIAHEINLLEAIYHKQSRKENIFDSYVLLHDCGVKELRNLYSIDYAKSAILAENVANECFDMSDYNEDTADGAFIRQNYNMILRSVASWHGTMWDNHKAFGKLGLAPHFETKENMLAWINNAMERPYRKYRKAEELGKIPKIAYENWINNITEKELNYYEEALDFLKTEYVKLIDERFNVGKNITVIHGDLHPGHIWLFKNMQNSLINDPEPARIGLCTEDLAMLIALHLADASIPNNVAKDFHDTKPWLDYYYKCLCEKVEGYSHEMFISDYKISVVENLFFPIRLINRGIYDFRMRDRAIRAFEVFVKLKYTPKPRQEKFPQKYDPRQPRQVKGSPYGIDNPVRKIDSISWIKEPTGYLCGQSCVAMLAAVSVDDVIKIMGTDKGTSQAHIRKALNYYGIRYAPINYAPDPNASLPELCMIVFTLPEYRHWSLYYKGVFYDPEFGVINEYPPNAVLSNVWEIFP